MPSHNEIPLNYLGKPLDEFTLEELVLAVRCLHQEVTFLRNLLLKP